MVAAMKKPKKESIGQRGKGAEKAVADVLDIMNTKYAGFAYERLPDARAAGGRLKQQISDFLCWWKKTPSDRLSIALEVKSTEHDYRLSKDKLEQLPRLHKAVLAGAVAVVLVHFKTIDQWRVATVDYFKYGQPSWDMRDLPLFPTAKDAMMSTTFFPES